MPGRTRLEMRIGAILRVGQEWALKGELDVWTVKQVHRIDCSVVLERPGVGTSSTRISTRVSFTDLAKRWEPADHTLLEAA
jgi:hypothetical protein